MHSWVFSDIKFFPPTQPAPKYMVDNERNTFNAAPDKGILNGPVTGPIKMSSLRATAHVKRLQKREETGDFWIDKIQHGQVSIVNTFGYAPCYCFFFFFRALGPANNY